MRCFKCGNENPNNALFCGTCGANLNENQVLQQAAYHQAQQVYQQQTVYPQPVNPNNQLQPVAYQQSKGLSTNQKVIIVVLLFVLLGLLCVMLFGNKGKTLVTRVKDNKKTIMIYMVGSNLESNSKIATAEIEAMERANVDLENTNVLLYTGGTSKWHNFVSNTENAIYKLTADGFTKIETYPKKNMGDASTLSDFIQYTYDNYKTGKYYLIFYDHGGAIDGAIYDDFTKDHLSLEDFDKAMKNSPFNSKNKIDAIIFRTCLNGTLEVASVFDDYANYIVYSEELTLGSSSSNVLGYFVDSVNDISDPIDIGNAFIDGYNKQMSEIDLFESQPVTYSIVDLSKIKTVVSKLDDYIKTLDVKTYYKEISTVRNRLYQYGSDSTMYDMVDLKEFILQTKQYSTGNSDELIKAIDEAVVRNNTNLSGSHGISVYFPYNGGSEYLKYFTNVYNKLDFSSNYTSFIKSFSSAKGQTSAFNFSFASNNFSNTENEVKLELTQEQQENIVKSGYVVFERLTGDRKDYYKIIYESNNSTIENGFVSTHMNNRFIKVYDEDTPDDKSYIALVDITRDGVNKKTVAAVILDTDKDILDPTYMVSSNLIIDDDNGTPKLGNMELISRDDRVQGVIYDTSDYDVVDIMESSPKILDKNGKVIPLDDWTYPKVRYGVELKLNKAKLEYTNLDSDGEYYVLFLLYDYNNNYYLSDIIKVGE